MSAITTQVLPDSGADYDWDDFVATHPDGTLYHTRAWQRIAARAFGHELHPLCARDARGRIRGILPLVRLQSRLFGHFMVSLPYVNYCGALTDDDAADAQLMNHACKLGRSLGVTHIEFRDRRPRTTDWPVRTDKAEMILDLADSEDAQWAALTSKVRAQVRRPGREGAVVRSGGSELIDDFYRVFSRNMRDLGTPVYPRTLFERIAEELGSRAEIVVVYLNDAPVAAGMLLHHGLTTEIPSASSLRHCNRLGVNMLLYWSCLQRSIARGARHFDFGRSSIDSGTYRFKRQWGAEPVPLYWHYWLRDGQAPPRLNPDNPKYALAINAWQRLPLWVANRLGPPLSRRLP